MKTGTIEDVGIRLEVVLGETSLSLRDFGTLGPGSIIALEALAGEPVELRAAGQLVARGEVVVIDENFGLRVTELAAVGARP
jgi:flagellar motor switch protein FliN/FliY